MFSNTASQRLRKFKEGLRAQYGYLAEPSWPLWRNRNNYVMRMSVREYLAMPRNRTCHNLLRRLPLPPGTKTLLGNGLNFCVTHKYPANKIEETISRYSNDVRRTVFWRDREQEDDGPSNSTYNPKLYFKSSTEFEPAGPKIEAALTNFTTALTSAQRRYQSSNPPNLTPRQRHLLTTFKESDTYIVIEADKNLGPCILERDDYIRRCIEEHLGDAKTYKIVSNARAGTIQSMLSREFGAWLGKYAYQVPKHERVYLRTARQKHPQKLARFRGTVKIHKTPNWSTTKEPLKFRPVIACCGIWINCWSKWLD